jgi:hypothetical protein
MDGRQNVMPIIKLHKTNEDGEDAGIIFVNTDQIVAISTGRASTEVQMTDGHTRWVKEAPEELVAMGKASST